MFQFIIGLIIFLALVLVVVILAQNSKGGGLSSQFGGSGASQLIGVKRTGDLLEKITWYMIIGIFALSLGSTALVPQDQVSEEGGFMSPNEQKAQETGGGFAPAIDTNPTDDGNTPATDVTPIDTAE